VRDNRPVPDTPPFAPEPPRGRVFEGSRHIRATDASATGRLRPLGDDFDRWYGAAAQGHRASARLELPGPAGSAPARGWPTRAADFDTAGHVNNTVYWAALEDVIQETQADPPRRGLLEYHRPILAGDRPGPCAPRSSRRHPTALAAPMRGSPTRAARSVMPAPASPPPDPESCDANDFPARPGGSLAAGRRDRPQLTLRPPLPARAGGAGAAGGRAPDEGPAHAGGGASGRTRRCWRGNWTAWLTSAGGSPGGRRDRASEFYSLAGPAGRVPL
jgi:hypothetical protein